MLKTITGPLAALSLLLLASSAARAGPPAWVTAEGSEVGFATSQAGAPVGGRFERFETQIGFDPDDLAASRVEVVIDMASVSTGSGERDTAIRSKDLFDVAAWPTAYFEVVEFAHVGDDRYRARGRLTMRDVTREVMLPFRLTIGPDATPGRLRARAEGTLAIDRLDYGVGQGLFQDTSVVPNAVEIRFDIQAVRATP